MCYVYDLEITTIKRNTEVRTLLMDKEEKAIIVIEDIDCYLPITTKRKEDKKKETPEDTDYSDLDSYSNS